MSVIPVDGAEEQAGHAVGLHHDDAAIHGPAKRDSVQKDRRAMRRVKTMTGHIAQVGWNGMRRPDCGLSIRYQCRRAGVP